jgi:hypothetical protein
VSLEKFLSTVSAAGDTTTATNNDTTSTSGGATPGSSASAAASNDANYEVNLLYMHLFFVVYGTIAPL